MVVFLFVLVYFVVWGVVCCLVWAFCLVFLGGGLDVFCSWLVGLVWGGFFCLFCPVFFPFLFDSHCSTGPSATVGGINFFCFYAYCKWVVQCTLTHCQRTLSKPQTNKEPLITWILLGKLKCENSVRPFAIKEHSWINTLRHTFLPGYLCVLWGWSVLWGRRSWLLVPEQCYQMVSPLQKARVSSTPRVNSGEIYLTLLPRIKCNASKLLSH